jgi:hypothetical protein
MERQMEKKNKTDKKLEPGGEAIRKFMKITAGWLGGPVCLPDRVYPKYFRQGMIDPA